MQSAIRLSTGGDEELLAESEQKCLYMSFKYSSATA